MRTSRLVMDYKGQFGEYWKKEAYKKLDELKGKLESKEIVIVGNVVKWSMGNIVPSDLVQLLVEGNVLSEENLKATEAAHSETARNFFKKQDFSKEQKMEINANFEKGTKVINILSGKVYVAK